jgi:hypothetical protein
MRFILLKDYTSVDELEEQYEEESEFEDFVLAVKEIFSLESYSLGVNESSFFVINHERKLYVQRERLVDLIKWVDEFPIIGHIIDELSRFKKVEILSALIDNRIPQVIFTNNKEYFSIREIVDDIVRNARAVEICKCVEKEPPSLLPPPSLIRAVEFLREKWEPWMCTDGRTAVKTKSGCYTIKA